MPALYVLATVWLWSLIPLAVKIAYQSFNVGFITLSRLAVGAAVFAFMDLAGGRGIRLPAPSVPQDRPLPLRLGPRAWVLIAGAGIGADLLLYTLGLRFTTASAASLIVSTDGIILALLGVLVLRERMSWLKAGAGIAALCGLLLVGWNGQDLRALVRSEYFAGNVIVLSAGCCWATYGVGQRVLARTPGGSLFPIFAVATVVGVVAALWQPVAHTAIRWQAVAAVAYLGLIGTGLAYILLVRGIERLEAATVGLLGSTLPLFVMVQAHVLMGEAITPHLVTGSVLVIAGVALVVQHQRVYSEP